MDFIMADPVNESVCIACQRPHDVYRALGLNSNDPMCQECRSYQQNLLQTKTVQELSLQQKRREDYFKRLYG